MNRDGSQPSLGTALKGRDFVHPVFDYMLIGGGLSLVVTLVVLLNPNRSEFVSFEMLPYFILLSNSAHFAASTVRLYTKPGCYQTMPFLTMAFPLVALGVLTLCLFQAERLGPHLQALYLTWSPYHYAAQAYGLAVMYSYRSGCALGAQDKKLLWWVSMFPFLFMFFAGTHSGVGWLVPSQFLNSSAVINALDGVKRGLMVLAVAMPVLLCVKVWRSKSGPMPLISLLVVVSNGIWWFVLSPLHAFVWATIFHGIQYLAIVIIFHVKDQVSRPENRHGPMYHVIWFYAASLLLGYALFNCLPLSFEIVGLGRVESVLLVVAAINIHHFIVDAYIWRLKKTDTNRQIVDSGVPSPA
jgi:hypothetical protein